jgi:hypothetical protein
MGDMLKDKLYSKNPHTKNDVKERIGDAVSSVSPQEIQCATKSVLDVKFPAHLKLVSKKPNINCNTVN